jgi:hypothetical protein
MKNSNLRNLVNKSKLAPIEGEMLKSIKGGFVAAPCKTKCGTNSASVGGAAQTK